MRLRIFLSFGAAMLCCIAPANAAGVSKLPAKAAALPLFTAFKTFCANTGANPHLVNAALKADGGMVRVRPGSSTENGTLHDAPFPLTLATWNVTVGGHQMEVSTGTAWPSRKFGSAKYRPHDFDSCTIDSFADEDASVAAIKKWIGVSPYDVSRPSPGRRYSPELTTYFYSYQLVGGRHVSVKGRKSIQAAEAEGRSWSVVLMSDPQHASIQFAHTLPNPAPKSAKTPK